MNEKYKLEDILKNLKLTKRSFLLSGKDTNDIDEKIKEIEIKLEKCTVVCKTILK